MANLVNHSVTNLINGVSQQAPAVRLDNQLEEQINCFSDVTKGLTIRNGLELSNVAAMSMDSLIPIEFTLDGTKVLLGLDSALGILTHVPLAADTTALAASITDPAYFTGATTKDIRTVETKDGIYVLNKKATVGLSSLETTYYTISINDVSTGATGDSWTAGGYDITISGVPTNGDVPITKVVSVTASTETYQIADLINADTALIAQTGTAEVIGTKGSYKIYFNNRTSTYSAPTLTTNVTSTITRSYSYVERDPPKPNALTQPFYYTVTSNPDNRIKFNPVSCVTIDQSGSTIFYWNVYGESISFSASQNATSAYHNGWTYYRGTYATRYDRVVYTNPGTYSVPYFTYEIRRERTINVTNTYSLASSSPVTSVSTADNANPDRGMVWVTGVSSNQTYSMSIDYTNSSGTDLTWSTGSGAVNVGTTPSNIRLNWVAQALANLVNGSNIFTATVYDNAIFIYSTVAGANRIRAINTDNNYDTTSIHGVARATISNTSGITDISNLPPKFKDGFKLRVDATKTGSSNYYLAYDAGFQGWKETGLDSTRQLDNNTMPYFIDKRSILSSNTITLAPKIWQAAAAGDSTSNKSPSFIDKGIRDIFFYGSRLGVATEDSIVMSAINKHDHFFRSTTSKTIESDRVDIQLDSSKIGFSPIENVMSYDGKLFVNTGFSQSVLLVNNAFSLTSARLSEVSSYTLGNFKPLPVNNSLYFALSNNSKTSIYNYTIGGAGGYQSYNLTKHIPHYMNGNIKRMAYANNATLIQLDNDNSTLYVQNRFSADGRMVQNAWHKWTLPYPVSYFTFYGNNLYVFMTATDSGGTVSTLVCKYDIIPQVVTQVENQAYIGWTPYLDCYTKDKTLIENFPEFIGINDQYGNRYDSVSLTAAEVTAGLTPVQKAYDSTTVNQTSVGTEDGPYYSRSGAVYYWHVAGDKNEIVFNSGATLISGNNGATYFDNGGFRYTKGEATVDAGYYEVSRAAITSTTFNTDNMIYGIPFKASVTLSEVIPRQQGQDGSYTVMNYARLMLHRMRMSLANSGVFKVIVSLTNRGSHTKIYTGSPLGKITLGKSGVSDINFRVPINGQSDNVTITLESDSAQPFNLLSTEWQAKLIQRGRNI